MAFINKKKEKTSAGGRAPNPAGGSAPHRILVVDDDASIRFFMAEFLKKEGFGFDIAGSGAEAIELLKAADYSLVLLDEKMPGMSGIDVLKEMRAGGMRMPVIMITAYGSRGLALKAMEEGAYDFFTKPVDIEVVRTVIKRALEKYELQVELEGLRYDLEESALRHEIIAESPSMRKALELARKVAQTDVTVFVSGESGSGKEIIARAVHRLSTRHDAPFVSVNCAAIPEGLLESELFGYEKGAFTGARHRHIGKFERAGGGTIFLDEIGDLTLNLQAKLLRVLQDRQIERLGGKAMVKVDIRVISATNKNISGLVKEGLFREDLFYRIKVFEIDVPPLRERKEDIPLLSAFFLRKYSAEIGKDIKGISGPAMRLLLGYRWQGNVREMENLFQRAIIVEEGNLIGEDTIAGIIEDRTETGPEATGGAMQAAKEAEEKRLIEDALVRARWRRQEAADILGISRKSLFLKMKKYGMGLRD
ncbi:MAG: sigma-54 dependent transcriptional regulator [Thermodesulfovibrionales bacterium]|nr:sigma-54 dependent transcriptional regulator [Thermodesulfovibrionales bacterium]